MTKMPQPRAGASAYTAGYDAWNRLVKLSDGVNTVAEYQYDARGRRVVKKSYTAGTLSETRHFYYSNAWQVLEERIGTSTNPNTQYVWGLNYVDEMVCRDRDANGGTTGDGTLEQTHYAVQDANFNVTALINTSGSVAERYRYTPYGQRTVLDDNFALDADGLSDVAFVYGHQGLRHDADSGLVENRNRVLHVTLGRFVQRDPMGYVDGMGLYEYAKSNPIIYKDPDGRFVGYSLCVVACFLGFDRVSDLSHLYNAWADPDKLPRHIRRQFELEARKELLGSRSATAVTSDEMREAVKRWAEKKLRRVLSTKAGIKLAKTFGPNAIPGLGQIASAVLAVMDGWKVCKCAYLCARGRFPI